MDFAWPLRVAIGRETGMHPTIVLIILQILTDYLVNKVGRYSWESLMHKLFKLQVQMCQLSQDTQSPYYSLSQFL